MKRLILLLTGVVLTLYSQNLQPPVTGDITSDYGPRNWNGYNWHIGIDYHANMWTEVRAVEGGDIVYIRYDNPYDEAGWRIRIRGDSATWTYMHLFQNSTNPISPDNGYEARWATLVDPSGQHSPENHYIFIFWINRNNNRAEKILSQRGGWWVRARPGGPGYDPNNPYILDQQGNRILTRGSVATGNVIAPSGNSSYPTPVDPHLHISASSSGYPYDINPLYYITHDQPNYTLNIIYLPPNSLFYHRPGAPESQQENERIRVNVNSANGLDLDRGFVYFFKPDENRVFDNAHRYAKITYGGPPPGENWEALFPSRITDSRGSITSSGVDLSQGVMISILLVV